MGSSDRESAARLFFAFFFFFFAVSAGSARDWRAGGAVIVGALTDCVDRVASGAVACGMLGDSPRMASSISPLGTGPVCSDTNPRDPADSRPRYRPSRVGGGAAWDN